MCIIGAFSFGGAERVMTSLANQFSTEHQVIYVALQEREPPAYNIETGVRVINGLGYRNKLNAISLLRKIINIEKPDVIISFLTQVNIITILSAFGKKTPVIISERNDPSKESSKIKVFLRDTLYPLASGVVFQTEDAKKYFSPRVQKKSTVISNPVYVKDEYLEYFSSQRKKEIVAVGRLEKQKNYPLLIHAYAKVYQQRKDYILKIYGQGSLKNDIEAIIHQLGLNDAIELCGACSDLHDRIKDSSIYVMTSDYEGMPNALMEAMALGLCCISSNCPVGGPRELIRDGQNGLLFETGNQNDLEQKLIKVMCDQQLREKMSQEAKSIIKDRNIGSIMNQWMKYINSIIGETQKRDDKRNEGIKGGKKTLR